MAIKEGGKAVTVREKERFLQRVWNEIERAVNDDREIEFSIENEKLRVTSGFGQKVVETEAFTGFDKWTILFKQPQEK
jgi:hypothetical protein